MGIAALVTGLVALACYGLTVPLNSGLLGVAGLVLSLVALVTGIVGRKTKSGIAGLVLGGVGLALAAIGFLMLSARPMANSQPPLPSPAMAAPPSQTK